jgi:FkbM family methyltransferase
MAHGPISRGLVESRKVTVGILRGVGLRHIVIPPLRGYFRYFPMQTGKITVWNQVAAHLWWLESRIRTTTYFGSMLDVDARDGCGRFIYYFGVWEPDFTAFIERTLKPGDCFIDVGANIGYYSLLASRLVGQSGKVVSIEAVPRTFEVLRRNLELNHSENVRAVNMAVWDKEETLTFFVSPDTIDSTSTAIPSLAEGRGLRARCDIPAASLGSLLNRDEIAAARLIKIDVEGAERQAISGFGTMLETSRRDLEVMVEVSIEAFDEIVAFFQRHGFFSYRLENDYNVQSYVGGHDKKKPQRLEVAPKEDTHVDLIFSRIDAAALT